MKAWSPEVGDHRQSFAATSQSPSMGAAWRDAYATFASPIP